jgi:hypothetical protein
MSHLRPCSDCDRHVRSDEVRCPFCGGALEVDDRPPPVPTGRIGRAALMAFGAALATASLAGCKGEEPATIGAEEGAPTARPETETRTAPREREDDSRRRPGSVEKADSAPMQSPFLVGAQPPPTPPTSDARPAQTVPPPVKTVTTAPTDSNWNQKRWNQAKPYGAPPADGMPEIV